MCAIKLINLESLFDIKMMFKSLKKCSQNKLNVNLKLLSSLALSPTPVANMMRPFCMLVTNVICRLFNTLTWNKPCLFTLLREEDEDAN